MANPVVQPVSAVQQYIDAFNKGDAKAMAAMCADPMSVHTRRNGPPCLARAYSNGGLVQGCVG